VTRALVRQVRVPGLDRPAALITLDNGLDHTKPNTFGPGGLASLDAAITEALAANPAFIALTGKPYIFSVGADLTGVPLVATREQALEVGRQGHRVFARLRTRPCRHSRSSTGQRWVAGSRLRCIATTGRCRAG
jgi:enoyl-CoA hydratase/carnithine racemase